MLGNYVTAVLRKAVAPMRGLAEVLLLIVSLALPAVAQIAGIQMPSSDSLFAYLGVALVALVILRVVVTSPYQLWREQIASIDALNTALAEPERVEIAHMASIRAEKRIELAAALREFHWMSFIEIADVDMRARMNDAYGRLLSLMGQVGVPESFDSMIMRFTHECSNLNKARREKGEDKIPGQKSYNYLEAMIAFLHGRLTQEGLSQKLGEHAKSEGQGSQAKKKEAKIATKGKI